MARLIGPLLSSLLLAPARAKFELTFLSDYQQGGWDTDAAEHVAYDAKSSRAFIASAESATVNVIDLSDPTKPEAQATLSVGGDLGFRCPEINCIYSDMDFGGAGTPCGYAPIVKIVSNDAGFVAPGWYSGPLEVDETMTSAEACQIQCANEASCSFFSYEDECLSVDVEGGEICDETGIRYHECYMKASYSLQAAKDAGFEKTSACTDYAVWEGGPRWDNHDYDEDWVGKSGPSECGNVRAESVQSVATATVSGFPNGVVIAAAPNFLEWANGYLALYDAATLAYMGCAEAGIKPEGITSMGHRVACINEGSARKDGKMDHEGSMTMCKMSLKTAPLSVEATCKNHGFSEDTFKAGAWKSAQEYRFSDVRLYGQNGDDVGLDLEPEHGAFIDANTFVVSMQDNNAYAFFDLASEKYTYLGGYGYLEMKLDASDKDDKISIKDGFGSDDVPVLGMGMPDQIAHLSVGGVHYLLTANEGGTRDGEDLIGVAEDYGVEFEGEELRLGGMGGALTCSDCGDKAELGRMLTTYFMPSDFASNACGMNSCSAKDAIKGLGPDFQCVYYAADYGGGGICGYSPMNKITTSQEIPKPGWFGGDQVVDATMTSPEACMALCAAGDCDYWTYEFEQGTHECFQKGRFAGSDCGSFSCAQCDEFVRYHQKWDDPAWIGASGPKTCFAGGKAPYSTTKGPKGTGSDGGVISVGGRSFTVYKYKSSAAPLERVFDSGSQFEEKTTMVNGGLCDGCDDSANIDTCETGCPFNSDDAPPAMDARSDAKGPEPECVTTGVMSDGTILAFIGLERTGGIMVYDVSDPTSPEFNDFLNVRNWMVGAEVPDEDNEADAFSAYMLENALNDGPESFVFISADDSPLGTELLIAVSPMAGRMTIYTIDEAKEPRGDDGSCKDTASCPYLPESAGGTGEALGRSASDVCKDDACDKFKNGGGGDGDAPPASKKKKTSKSDDTDLIIICAVLGALALCMCLAAGVFFKKSKAAEEKYAALAETNLMHQKNGRDPDNIA